LGVYSDRNTTIVQVFDSTAHTRYIQLITGETNFFWIYRETKYLHSCLRFYQAKRA